MQACCMVTSRCKRRLLVVFCLCLCLGGLSAQLHCTVALHLKLGAGAALHCRPALDAAARLVSTALLVLNMLCCTLCVQPANFCLKHWTHNPIVSPAAYESVSPPSHEHFYSHAASARSTQFSWWLKAIDFGCSQQLPSGVCRPLAVFCLVFWCAGPDCLYTDSQCRALVSDDSAIVV